MKFFDRSVAALFGSILATIGFLAFASEFEVPLGRWTTLIVFSILCLTGILLCAAGLLQFRLLALFGSAGLGIFGFLGIRLGSVAFEAMSNQSPGVYQVFFQEHFMGLAGLSCALLMAHVIVERPLIKQRNTSKQPAKA